MSHNGVPEGKFTETIYTMIKEQKYPEAIKILDIELQSFPRSRAALSLLGHCYYMLQDYANAVAMYELLVTFYGEVEEYKVYYAQSLYKAGMYAEATRAALRVEGEQYGQRMMMLQAATKYEQDDLVGCKAQCDRCLTDDPEVVVAQACILFKENKYDDARAKFTEAMNTLGYQPDIAYNIALCHYQLKQYGPALKHMAEIIERGVREHPELSVGSSADGIDVRSVGNSQVLRETALVEAFNLKAAIEYNMKNIEQAKEALVDMPPRSEAEVDPVTLHNQALMNMDDDPTTGFRKLNFLLRNPPFPQPTFGNLLLLYCKFYHYDLAADVLAENTQLTYKMLSGPLYEFLDACIMVQTSPEEAYRKFDDLTNKHIEGMRKLTKHIQDSRISRDNEQIKESLKKYDEALEAYIPVLMAQARIYWEREHYTMVERIFRQVSFYGGREGSSFCPCRLFRIPTCDPRRRGGVRGGVGMSESLTLFSPIFLPIYPIRPLYARSPQSFAPNMTRGSSTWRTYSSCKRTNLKRPFTTTSQLSRNTKTALWRLRQSCWQTCASVTL